MFPAPPLAALQQKQEGCRDDAQGFHVADRHDPAGIGQDAARFKVMAAAVFPAVHATKKQSSACRRQQQSKSEGVLE
jgi:hypothetical protein